MLSVSLHVALVNKPNITHCKCYSPPQGKYYPCRKMSIPNSLRHIFTTAKCFILMQKKHQN